MITKFQRENANKAFYEQEVTAKITFRMALNAVENVACDHRVPGAYFCKRDVERLERALQNIREKMAKSS